MVLEVSVQDQAAHCFGPLMKQHSFGGNVWWSQTTHFVNNEAEEKKGPGSYSPQHWVAKHCLQAPPLGDLQHLPKATPCGPTLEPTDFLGPLTASLWHLSSASYWSVMGKTYFFVCLFVLLWRFKLGLFHWVAYTALFIWGQGLAKSLSCPDWA